MSVTTSGSGLWNKIRPLLALNNHKRPWGFLATVALSVGLPVFIALWLGSFSSGITASIGGLASLYLRQTPLLHRLITMSLVTVGFCACFTLILLSDFSSWATGFSLGMVAFWATFTCRYFAIPPPGSFFFILVACIASAMPFEPFLIPERAGFILFGCLGACVLTLAYSLIQYLSGHTKGIHPAEPIEPRVVAILLESTTIALVIVGSYLLALWLEFAKPYWVPISCAAIMQGASFRDVGHRNIHRIVGTSIGMGLAWVIFSLSPAPWILALLITGLSFVIEILVTRNYDLAVIFITPLTIILAEVQNLSQDINSLILLRLMDVLLGSIIGYLGGWMLHQRHIYDQLEQHLLRIRPKLFL